MTCALFFFKIVYRQTTILSLHNPRATTIAQGPIEDLSSEFINNTVHYWQYFGWFLANAPYSDRVQPTTASVISAELLHRGLKEHNPLQGLGGFLSFPSSHVSSGAAIFYRQSIGIIAGLYVSPLSFISLPLSAAMAPPTRESQQPKKMHFVIVRIRSRERSSGIYMCLSLNPF